MGFANPVCWFCGFRQSLWQCYLCNPEGLAAGIRRAELALLAFTQIRTVSKCHAPMPVCDSHAQEGAAKCLQSVQYEGIWVPSDIVLLASVNHDRWFAPDSLHQSVTQSERESTLTEGANHWHADVCNRLLFQLWEMFQGFMTCSWPVCATWRNHLLHLWFTYSISDTGTHLVCVLLHLPLQIKQFAYHLSLPVISWNRKAINSIFKDDTAPWLSFTRKETTGMPL